MIASIAMAVLLAQAPAEIRVGGLFDLTGVTSDVGKSYAQGVRDAVAWTNDNGGINGKKIHLFDVDYGYKIPEAVAAHKRMTTDDKVIMVNGPGTGVPDRPSALVDGAEVPYVPAQPSGPP